MATISSTYLYLEHCYKSTAKIGATMKFVDVQIFTVESVNSIYILFSSELGGEVVKTVPEVSETARSRF